MSGRLWFMVCGFVVAAAVGVVAAVGCGDSDERAGSGGAGAASAGGAGGASAPVDPLLAPFVGTWRVETGQNTLTCAGQSPMTSPASGQVEIVALPDAKIRFASETGCATEYTVSGSTATATPGQKCEQTAESGKTVTEVVSGSFVTSDGKTAQLTADFTSTIAFKSNTTTVTCAGTGTSRLTRVK